MRLFPGTRGVSCLAGMLALAFSIVACGGSGTNPTSPKIDPSVLPAMDLMIGEKALGSATAPNTIIEYSSFTCPHCRDFHEITLPQHKSTYIDPGSVRFVFRNSPRDTADLTAAMLARCAGDRYFGAVDALFAAPSSWVNASDPVQALGDVMRRFGMTQGVIDACKASTPLRDAIQQMKQEGLQRWQYQGVPAFVVNDIKLPDGFKYLSDFAPYLHPQQ